MSLSSTSLQEKQKAALLRVLAITSAPATTTSTSSELANNWKVLIYDRFSRDVISPVLKLHELRQQGVTLHMLLESAREEIPDVPAIYFVQPTPENIERIAVDCGRHLYHSSYLNFVHPIQRSSLETLARRTVDNQSANVISKVIDRTLNFVSLEPQLFTLNQQQSYVAYNDPAAQEHDIQSMIHTIVEGLFSVLVTMEHVPVIRCRRDDNGPSVLVAKKLCAKLREHLLSRSELFSESVSSGFQRPVLIIMDRNEDLSAALHHPSTYQALVDDLLHINMNRVKVHIRSGNAESKKQEKDRTYDLDVNQDVFFRNHAGDLFPDAIAANESDMKEVTKREQELRHHTGGGDSLAPLSSDDSNAQDASNPTHHLVNAVDTLPILLEKKKILELHTNIFQATFDQVAARHVPSFSMLEQQLITNAASVDMNEILSLVNDREKGNLEDKVRLMVIYYLTSGVSSAELQDMETSIHEQQQESNIGTKDVLQAWYYIRNHPTFQHHASVGESIVSSPKHSTSSSNSTNPSMAMFKGLAGNLAGQAQGWLQQAAASVQQFLPENKKLHITRVTDAICELRPNTEDDSFLYLDPKVKNSSDENVPRHRTPFREAIVFMIGGGNYNEYLNLQAYAKAQKTHSRNIVYGSTELLNPSLFLQQLNSLHQN